MVELKTNVTELPESRVRVEAEVPAEEVQRRIEAAAKALGKSMKIPGFRKGKVPAPVVIKRVGREAVLDEAVRGSLTRWYIDAIDAAGIAPVGSPNVDLAELPVEGQPLTFSIEIGVRPKAKLGKYLDLEVGKREVDISDARIDAELENLRDRFARLETADRPAENGDFVVVDFTANADGEQIADARDEMIELGSGRQLEAFDENLTGAAAGDTRSFDVSFPEDHEPERLAGKTVAFEVSLKEVKAKQLPELDDDFAADAGFDSIEELRADIREKIEEAEGKEIESEYREAVVDAAAEKAKVDVPDALVEARAQELWDQVIRAMARQGISKEVYLQISGATEEQQLEEAKPNAERALRREAVLAAIAEKEGIEDDPDGEAPALRKAVDLLVERSKPIPLDRAKAREKLWTPGSK